VILAGGVGSRFWPVSTPSRPKQLLPLAGEQPLIRQTVDRIRPMVNDERIRILTGERLAEPLIAAVPGLGRANLLLEPEAKGTAPVLAWAAHEIVRSDERAVMASLHADHVIEPAESFRSLLQRVARAAVVHERLFTIGAVPTRAETGYGYIRSGAPLPGEEGLYEVGEFVEKPKPEVAERFVREGYLWNTGLFVWPAALFLSELHRHTPELASLLPLLAEGRVAEFFARAPLLTVDTGVLERSQRVAVARATFHWDDVGAWDAVARTRPVDANGNVATGDAHLVDSKNCIAWADSGSVVVFGGEDLVVVRTAGTTFVAPRARTADLKRLLSQLPERLQRPEDS
jgi:mannose-1-phosphate guanylyltransferase